MTSDDFSTAPGTGLPAGCLGDHIERRIGEAHALRADTIAWALKTFARWIWHAWTAGIREPRAVERAPSAGTAIGRAS